MIFVQLTLTFSSRTSCFPRWREMLWSVRSTEGIAMPEIGTRAHDIDAVVISFIFKLCNLRQLLQFVRQNYRMAM